VQALVARHGLPRKAAERLLSQASFHELSTRSIDRLAALLAALAIEPAPPTTVTTPEEAVDVHIADSLSGLVAPPMRTATRIADVGAGAGFPGLVLAAALPTSHVDLIESTARKCEVISRLADVAGIPNATAIPARAEEWAATDGAEAYEIVTARAVSSLAVLAEYAAPLLRVGGCLVAWKGACEVAEERAGRVSAQVLGLESQPRVPVRPFKGSRERSLYVYVKREPTPPRFPRRPGMAAKRPLGS
jgi:16S rRNA (guanine527-N7)-methyltransferase